MTCRPMLWIAASVVAVGALTSTPSVAVGAPDPTWTVTIEPPSGASHHLEITGDATRLGLEILPVESVTVTAAPLGLPETCGSAADLTTTATVSGGRYATAIDVRCNGPHQIQVVARTGDLTSGDPARADIGVAEPPETPDAPGLDVTSEGGLLATWESNDPDSAGSVLQVNFRTISFGPGVTQATLPPSDRTAAVSVQALRWGAGGPNTSTVASEFSMGNLITLPPSNNPNTPPDPPDPPDPPSNPPSNPPPGGGGPSGTNPPSTTGGGVPTRGTGATSTTLPEGYSEELPFGAPDDAFVPGAEPSRRPSSETEERAVSTSPSVSGLVRTSEKRSPGLVAPFALGLMMITIAAHIAWYLRRSRPSGGGQVRLP